MRVAAVLAIAACGSPASKPALENTTKPSTRSPKLVPCPSDEELAPLVKAAWSNDDEVKVGNCVPFRRNGKAHWWLEGPAANREDGGYVPTGYAVLDERRAVIWKHRESIDSFGYYYGQSEAADLDGDGNDEVLYERTTGEGGMSRGELVIVHFAPAPTIKTIVLGGGGMDQTCDGKWVLVPAPRRGKLIDVTRTGACDDDYYKSHQRYDAQGTAVAP
jgi:hypothetical protein